MWKLGYNFWVFANIVINLWIVRWRKFLANEIAHFSRSVCTKFISSEYLQNIFYFEYCGIPNCLAQSLLGSLPPISYWRMFQHFMELELHYGLLSQVNSVRTTLKMVSYKLRFFPKRDCGFQNYLTAQNGFVFSKILVAHMIQSSSAFMETRNLILKFEKLFYFVPISDARV
jgi:hypothetical protein